MSLAAFWAGLATAGRHVIVAPATIQETDPRIFLSNRLPLLSIQDAAAGSIAFAIEQDAAYYQGQGAYEINPDTDPNTTPSGYQFWFLGTGFVLEGPANPSGGTLAVSIDNQPAGTGSCYAAKTTRQPFYQSPTLVYGTHYVKVTKSAGLAIFLDQIRLLP